MEAIKRRLEENPPQKFDVARKVYVFNSRIKFVEIELSGCQIQRKTIQLPREWLVADSPDEHDAAHRLTANYRVLEGLPGISGKPLQDKVNDLRSRYSQQIEGFGRVMFRKRRKVFEADFKQLSEAVQEFQKGLEGRVQSALAESRERLIGLLLPRVLDRPPNDLLGQISDDKPTAKHVRCYLERRLDGIIPQAKSLMSEMRLQCTFKGVTHETLNSPDFQKRVREVFQLDASEDLFDEFSAARARGEKVGLPK